MASKYRRRCAAVWVENDSDDESSIYSPAAAMAMRVRHIARIACAHLALYLFVMFYMLGGAYVFQQMEGETEIKQHEMQQQTVQLLKTKLIQSLAITNKPNEIDDQVRLFLTNLSSLHISIDNYLIMNDPFQTLPKRWSFPACVLFSFTILTTIGYGNITPTTKTCQIFTMIYGSIGIPLFLITIADLGRFSKTGIMAVVQMIYKKELKKQGEMKFLREVGEVFLVAAIFVGFIAAGSAILPLWETQLTYFDSVYFSFMSLTTIGLGDLVPRRMDFLFPTLIYLTIGLWLTTALVEQLADVFRLVHYAGRQVKNVKGITVWLGGRRLSVGGLIQTVCRRVGMSDHLIGQINWDRTLDQALAGVQPPSVPIFPWHFADFVEQDPPLIDLSLDFDQMEGSFYCTQPVPRKPRRTSLMSAPIYNPVIQSEDDENSDGSNQNTPEKTALKPMKPMDEDDSSQCE